MILESTISCPKCGAKEKQQMLENVCQAFYRCSQCKAQIKAKDDECCVYCSYADVPCPNAQLIGSACCSRD